MIISEEQVQLVLEYLHTHNTSTRPLHLDQGDATEDLMDRVKREIALAPETRVDRVAMGREFIASQAVSSDQVAAKMIGRMISDSMR
jgi:hypothetical protein